MTLETAFSLFLCITTTTITTLANHHSSSKHHTLSLPVTSRLTYSRLHPASSNPAPAATLHDPTPSSSEKESSEASSYAHVLRREHTNKRNFKRVIVSPPHLLLASTARPAPPRPFLSSPAIVMQSPPPSPAIQPIAKSMTFPEVPSHAQNYSAQQRDHTNSLNIHIRKLKYKRPKGPSGLDDSIDTASPIPGRVSHSKHHHLPNTAFPEFRPILAARQISGDSFSLRDVRRRPDHPGKLVSFTSTITSPTESIKLEDEEMVAQLPDPSEEAPKQGFVRTLTVHSIVPGTMRREMTRPFPPPERYTYQHESAQDGLIRDEPSASCCGLFKIHSRQSGKNVSRQRTCATKITTIKRKNSYIGSDGLEYTHDQQPGLSFLPSEMQRVNTPPMGKRSPSPGWRPRGFFFDFGSPPVGIEEAETRRDSVAGSREIGMHVSKRSSSVNKDQGPPDYFQQKMKQVDIDAEDGEDEVAVDVPEHLPGSPLCPLHLKNAARGQMLCPIHGRGSIVGAKDGRATLKKMMMVL
jgi:hypothetical protein